MHVQNSWKFSSSCEPEWASSSAALSELDIILTIISTDL